MSSLVLGGAYGVALKSILLWRYSWADSLGFTLELRKIFRVMTACGKRRSHLYAWDLGSLLANPDKNDLSKLLYHVQLHLCVEYAEGLNDTWLIFLTGISLTWVMLYYLKDIVLEKLHHWIMCHLWGNKWFYFFWIYVL